MLISIDPLTGKSQIVNGSEECPLMNAAKRVHEECAGWKEYRAMGEQYKTVSLQELQHAFLAMHDILAYISKHGDEDEKAELLRFTQSIVAG